MMSEGDWFYCLKHHKVEPRDGCRSEDRLGPYATEVDANNWRADFDRRNQAWEDDDREWRGED